MILAFLKGFNVVFSISITAKHPIIPTPPNERHVTLDTPFLLSPLLNPSHLLSREQRILISQKLPTIRLSKRRNSCRIQSPRLRRRSSRNTKTQRGIIHAIDNNTLVLRAVLGPTSNVCLDDVATVEEGHLAVGFDPDLVAGMLRQDWKSGDVEAEFESFGEFAYCFISNSSW